MFVDIISDLHIEVNGNFYIQLLEKSTSKKIIIAGDIGPIKMPEVQKTFVWLCNKYEEVIYVPGNHEYYSTSINYGNRILNQLEDYLPSLTILRPGKMTVIGDYKVIGDTLWVPYSMRLLNHPINDLSRITGIIHEIGALNKAARQFFEETLDNKTILITHHIPHIKCMPDKYLFEPTNCWFVSDESEMLDRLNPYMVIFGHTHDRMDFVYKNTRYINNAYGYHIISGGREINEQKGFKLLTLDI